MASKSEQLALRISRLQTAIRKKYREFKHGIVDTEQSLEKQYKPIITEIRKNTATTVKDEPMEVEETAPSKRKISAFKEEWFQPEATSSPKSEPHENTDFREVISTPEGQESASQFIEKNFKHPLTKKYMLAMIDDVGSSKSLFDRTYGPRLSRNGKTLMVGNKPITFSDDGEIVIENKLYGPTEGLYELLFKRRPDPLLYNERDTTIYKNIMIHTSAHMIRYKESEGVRRNASLKYRYVISKLFPEESYGTGFKSVASRDVIYWNDPNELCDRLKLLVASAEVGNKGHKNEIINIVEELKEEKIISGWGNSRFRSLLR